MEAILYTNVVHGNVSEVDRILKVSSLPEKVKMLKYVCHSHRIYFSIFDDLPSEEVTSLILQNIMGVIDDSKVHWDEALHIAVRYRKHDIVSILLSKRNVMSTTMRYTSSNVSVEVTPMDISAYSGDARMIALLLSHNIHIYPHQYGGSRYSDTEPIEVIKLQSAMDDYILSSDYVSSDYDLARIIYHGMYDKMLVFIVASPVLLRPLHVGEAIDDGRHNISHLLHIHFKQTTYGYYGKTHFFDLPSLQEVSLYTLRLSSISEELSTIRNALRILKEDEKWMEIENDGILYPLIRKAIESHMTTEKYIVRQIPSKEQINR